jgi:uncharacterized protein (TIGR00251 family)
MIDASYYSYNDLSKRATIYLKVKASSSKDSVEEFVEIESKKYLKITVKEGPVDGKANKSIIKMLSKLWKLKQNQLEFIKGSNQNIKLLEVKDIKDNEIIEILKSYVRV